jgi:hypothetical protein
MQQTVTLLATLAEPVGCTGEGAHLAVGLPLPSETSSNDA